jgi:hypothetical protein
MAVLRSTGSACYRTLPPLHASISTGLRGVDRHYEGVDALTIRWLVDDIDAADMSYVSSTFSCAPRVAGKLSDEGPLPAHRSAPGCGPASTPEVRCPRAAACQGTQAAVSWRCLGASPWWSFGAVLVLCTLPRPERPQVGRRRVPGMGQRLQSTVQLFHLGGREMPVDRPGVGDDLFRGGGAGNDATHLGMRQ